MSLTKVQMPINIEGIEEPTIVDYFATINQEKFEQTAGLFAQDGELHAPFEKPIIGSNAIASYLAKEATGMKLLPVTGIYDFEPDFTQIKVIGKVKTPLFSVNVAWYFRLNSQEKIAIAKIKLLASPQELLGLRKAKNQVDN